MVGHTYRHTQIGWVLIVGLGVALLLAALPLRLGLPGWTRTVLLSILFVAFVNFATLTVQVADEEIALSFGPGLIGRTAMAIASSSVARVNANQLSHTFDPIGHGFKDMGMTPAKGLELIRRAIAANIAALGGPSNVQIGIQRFTMRISDTVRIVVTGHWDGDEFRFGDSFLQRLIDGKWVPW